MKRRTRGAEARTGFTLIEVLVVVAIIALLVAVLLPSLAQARWQAKNVACRAHLHDLGLAFTMYAGSGRDGYFPVVANYEDSYRCLWKARMLSDYNILLCPGTKNVVRPQSLLNGPVQTLKWMEDGKSDILLYNSDLDHVAANRDDSSGGHSYEYNAFYGGVSLKNGWPEHRLMKHQKRITHYYFAPHNMMLVHDADEQQSKQAMSGNLGCTNSLGAFDTPSAQAGNNCPQPWDNHNERGMNMMFADGHSQWIPKVRGDFMDLTPDSSGVPKRQVRKSDNASVDLVWDKSSCPWRYMPKR